MFTPSKLAVLFTAALSVAAMPSHVVRNSLNHREIAVRVALPEAAPVAEIEARNMFVYAKRMMRVKRDETSDCEEDGNSDVPPPTPKDTKPTSSTPSENQEVEPTSTPLQNLNVKPDPTTSTPTPSPTPTNTGSGGGKTYTGQGTRV